MDGLIRLIPFKARIITGKEYGEWENATQKNLSPYPWASWQNTEGFDVNGWPESDLHSGKEGMVVGSRDGYFLICLPGEIPHWVQETWLRVIEGQDA